MTNKIEYHIGDVCTEDGLEDLVGKKILNIGLMKGVEGGLTIDYVTPTGPVKDPGIKRIVLGFNDNGTWVIWHGVKGKENYSDTLKKKIREALDIVAECPEKSALIDDPIHRGYSIQYEGKEILFLKIMDIKAMPEDIREWFTTAEPKIWYQEGHIEKCIYNDLLMWSVE